MSRKTNVRARKLLAKMRAGYDPDLERARMMSSVDGVVARSLPFRGNPIFKSDPILIPIRVALQGMLDRSLTTDGKHAFDVLACCVGEAKIRYFEIGGAENTAMVLLEKADQALKRTHERWERTKEWGLDGLAIQELKDAVSLFEEVLMASSPNQMIAAEKTYKRFIELSRKGKLKKSA